jgi:hypothetical protein
MRFGISTDRHSECQIQSRPGIPYLLVPFGSSIHEMPAAMARERWNQGHYESAAELTLGGWHFARGARIDRDRGA